MTQQGFQRERRSEARHRAPTNHISWAQENASGTHPGWLNDVAASSIAFVTSRRDQPSPGEAIELTFTPGGPCPQRRLVRVVRTAPYDRFFSLVGCRNEPAEDPVPAPQV